MTITPDRVLRVLVVIAFAGAVSETARAYATFVSTWPDGDIVMNLQLSGGANLTDRSVDFNAAVEPALTTWNAYMRRSRFVAVESPDGHADGDFINQVVFDSDFYGESFGRGTIAITTRWTVAGKQRVEADVVFNSAFRWDSYRGSMRASTWDIRRIALHEFGHALGLDHPDGHGQRVNAIMNSIVGDLETLTDDDIRGAQAIYGEDTTGITTIPPRIDPAALLKPSRP